MFSHRTTVRTSAGNASLQPFRRSARLNLIHGHLLEHQRPDNGLTMALLLLILTAIPTVTGTAQAISAQKRQNEELKEKIPFFLTTTFTTKSGKETEVYITLKEGKVTFLPTPRRKLGAESDP